MTGCSSSALTVPSSVPATMSFTYSSSAWPYLYSWDPEVYFSNSDSLNCPITSCSMYEGDCSTPRIDTVIMAASSPWAIAAAQNIIWGYGLTPCSSCTNGVQTV
jgi:hypothetical protein